MDHGPRAADDPLRIATDHANVLPRRIARLAVTHPEQLFLVETSGRSLTYAQCHEALLRCCAYLRSLGLRPGDRILSFLPSSIDAQLLWLGASCAGLWEVPANPELRGTFLEHVFRDSGARHCFVRPEQIELAAAARSAGIATTVVEREDPCLLAAPAQPLESYPTPGDVSTIIYTSGTTGAAKGVIVPWAQLASSIGRLPSAWLSANDVVYAPWPMFHVTGRTPLMSMAYAGGRVVLREKLSMAEFWRDVREHRCTSATVNTTLLLATPERADDRDHCMRVVFGTGPGAPNLRLQERFGVRVVLCYGSTELGFPLANRHLDERSAPYVGWLREGYEGRIVDASGHEVADGGVGELHVRPPARELMMQGYLGQPEATAKAVVDGWYRTGDAFARDANGAFRFIDRLRDTIRRFGENISATGVETVVLADAQVAECCVTPVASTLAGQEILLLVVPRAGQTIDAAALYERLATNLPRYMRPAYIRVVNELPKTPSSKVRKVALGELASPAGAWRSPAALAPRNI
ncbi:MAG: AMP-binding protein [Casimicrobiaceae bacterium]